MASQDTPRPRWQVYTYSEYNGAKVVLFATYATFEEANTYRKQRETEARGLCHYVEYWDGTKVTRTTDPVPT